MTAAIAPARTAVVAAVRARAAALDAGTTDVRTDLAEIGGHGLLTVGLGDTDMRDITVVIEEVAAESLTVAFSLWAQRMSIEYLWRAPESLRERYLDELGTGRRPGVTAMAAALKHLAGLGDLPLRATGANRRVSGPIAWASNVFDDAVIVFPFHDADGTRRVAVVDAAADGVGIRPAPQLLALDATASTAVDFADVAVPDDRILTADLPSFAATIRPAFLLLQTAFCSGVAQASVTAAGTLLDGLGSLFRDEYSSLAAQYALIRKQLHRFAADPPGTATAALIRLRLDAARVAVTATRLESTLRGGIGYTRYCDTNRRFREAAFLPVQSPSEGQLRWELSQCD